MTVKARYNAKHITLIYFTTDTDKEQIYIPNRKYFYLLGDKTAFAENEFYLLENDYPIRVYFANKQIVLDTSKNTIYRLTYKRLSTNKYDLLAIVSDEKLDIEPYIALESINVNLGDVEAILDAIDSKVGDIYNTSLPNLQAKVDSIDNRLNSVIGQLDVGIYGIRTFGYVPVPPKLVVAGLSANAGSEASATLEITEHLRGQIKIFVKLDNSADYIRLFVVNTYDSPYTDEFLLDEVTNADRLFTKFDWIGTGKFVVRAYSSSNNLNGYARLVFDYYL